MQETYIKILRIRAYNHYRHYIDKTNILSIIITNLKRTFFCYTIFKIEKNVKMLIV